MIAEDLVHQCANYKVSPECFSLHFGVNGIEFGEEDVVKDRRYNECLKTAGLLLNN